MIKEKPYLWLQRGGRYYVEAGDSELGVLVRIDNFIDNMEAHIKKLKDGHSTLAKRQKAIEKELLSIVSYSEQIEKLRKKLEKIDKELGVNKK